MPLIPLDFESFGLEFANPKPARLTQNHQLFSPETPPFDSFEPPFGTISHREPQ
jgi:hypothetical protein